MNRLTVFLIMSVVFMMAGCTSDKSNIEETEYEQAHLPNIKKQVPEVHST